MEPPPAPRRTHTYRTSILRKGSLYFKRFVRCVFFKSRENLGSRRNPLIPIGPQNDV